MASAAVSIHTGRRGTTAAFRLSGNATLTAAAVTQRLGIEPTCAFETGAPVSSRSTAIRHGSLWLLASSPAAETGTELAGHLDRLLVILEPAAAALWELVRVGYDANWLCYIASHATSTRPNSTSRPCNASSPSPEIPGSTSTATTQCDAYHGAGGISDRR